MLKVYSVIVTYNGSKWIEKCIKSLQESSVKSIIIVVDNNSSDNTIQIVIDKFPNVSIIRSSENIGFGRANNIALSKALKENADFALLLNQDAWIEPDCIEKLIGVALKNKKVGIIAPLNFSPNGNLENGFQYELNSQNCPGILSDLLTNNLQKFYPVTQYINASCWLLTSECINITGGFDPVFNHYGEDVDYCKRAIFHGFQAGVCTSAKEYHAKEYFKRNANNFSLLLSENKKKYLNNYLLIKIKDLNLNLISNYVFESLMLLGLLVKYLLNFSFRYFLVYLIIFFEFQKMMPLIWTNRKKCLQKNSTFL